MMKKLNIRETTVVSVFFYVSWSGAVEVGRGRQMVNEGVWVRCFKMASFSSLTYKWNSAVEKEPLL